MFHCVDSFFHSNYTFDFIAVCLNHRLGQVAPDTVQLTAPTFLSLTQTSAGPGIAHPYPQWESSSLPSIPVCRTADGSLWEKRGWGQAQSCAQPRSKQQADEEGGLGQPGVGAAAGERYPQLPPALMLRSGSLHLARRMEALEKSHSAVGGEKWSTWEAGGEKLTGEKEEWSPSSPLPANWELSGL